jgi:hypothetical protein
MRFHASRPSRAMIVASLALVLALGGSAYAASQINGKNIKKGSIPGNRIKNDSVTGKQVNESTLDAVPNASHATNADNATSATSAMNSLQLGGVTAGQYLHGEHLVTAASGADSTTTPQTATATCPSGEVAIGGGGENDAPTGDVTFDSLQLQASSMTVIMFKIAGTPSWHDVADVICAVP